MNDAVRMSVLQSVCHPAEHLCCPERIRYPGLEPAFQCPPCDIFGKEGADAFVGLAYREKRDEAGVFELGDASGFAQEGAGFFMIGRGARSLNLDGDRAIQFGVASTEDVAKRAGPQF